MLVSVVTVRVAAVFSIMRFGALIVRVPNVLESLNCICTLAFAATVIVPHVFPPPVKRLAVVPPVPVNDTFGALVIVADELVPHVAALPDSTHVPPLIVRVPEPEFDRPPVADVKVIVLEFVFASTIHPLVEAVQFVMVTEIHVGL